MKLKVNALIFFLVSLYLASIAWAVVVPKSITNLEPIIYENATIVQAMESEGLAQVVYSVATELEKVIKWYKDMMQKRGWKVVMEMNMADNSMLNLAKDQLTLVVNARAEAEGQTTVHLVVEDK